MKCDIEAEKEKGLCPLCTKTKEQLLFVLKSEVYNGRACATHMHALISQAKKTTEPVPNGQQHVDVN